MKERPTNPSFCIMMSLRVFSTGCHCKYRVNPSGGSIVPNSYTRGRTHVYSDCQAFFSFFFSLCISALENHLLTKGCSHFLVASYTLSLLQVYFEPATLLNRAATTPGTSCPTLFDKCVGSLTSHGILELKEL